MGQADVQNMMEAFKNFVSTRIAKQNSNIDKQRADTEAKQQIANQKFQEGELENSRNQLKNLHEFQTKTLEAAQFINSLAQYHDMLDLTKSAEGGLHIPGETSRTVTEPGPSQVVGAIAPLASPSILNSSLNNNNPTTLGPQDSGQAGIHPVTMGGQPQQVQQRILHLPYNGQMMDIPLRTPGEKLQQAKEGATEAGIAQEPSILGRLRETNMKQQGDLIIELMKQSEENSRKASQNASNESIGRAHDAARIQAAQITSGGLPPADYSGTIQKFQDGTYTLDDMAKLFPKPGARQAFATALTTGGIVPLAKEDKQFLNQSNLGAKAITDMQKFQDLWEKMPIQNFQPLSEDYNELKNLQKQIQEDITKGAVLLKTSGRLSKETLARIDGAYVPEIGGIKNAVSPNAIRLTNLQRMQGWKDAFAGALNDHLASYPKAQREALIQKYGLGEGDTQPQPTQHQVGDIVTLKDGRKAKITKFDPTTRQAEFEEVKQ